MTDIRFGIAGLGAASTLILPYFSRVPGIRLAAAADIRADAREAFTRTYGLPAFDAVETLCGSGAIDAIWIETPNDLHCEHSLIAAANGKHIVCAKPMAMSLADCDRIAAAANRANVQVLQGHSKVFDPPIRAMRKVVASGRLGRVIQADVWLHNDWLQRPRLAAELNPSRGGGLIFRQVPHLVDILNYVVGEPATNVRAIAGRWDPGFNAEGNVSALINYQSGAAASFSINSYGYFDVTELTWGIDGLGRQRDPASARRSMRRTGPLTEDDKYRTAFRQEPPESRKQGKRQPFFGLTIVHCERGAIRQSPNGLFIYSAVGREEVAVEPYVGRAAELIELRDAISEGRGAFPGVPWGKATLEACLAIAESAKSGQTIPLRHQAAP